VAARRHAVRCPFADPLYREDSNLPWSLIPGARIETSIEHRDLSRPVAAARRNIIESGP
jgi:hypothetical protein